jgi:serine/threonine-protein kinase
MPLLVPAFRHEGKFAPAWPRAPGPRAAAGLCAASDIGYSRLAVTASTTERVGRYQLLEPIGVGPSGAVWRAKVFGVAGFERQFAVKRFHAELTATTALAQALSAAARAYGGLEHPRIARMSEFGVAQGTTFTAVELVAGLDALRLISEGRLAGVALAPGGALALVSQAARAVGYAHGRGLTHLGLAPTNVIVTAEGDVKITDFGVLSATLPPRPADAQRLANRVAYLAPEQLAAEATSAATDVFALGVLALELVTGQRAFGGDSPQAIAQAVLAGSPVEPPLPRPIGRVLQRCLARSPFERFPDARALADALDAALRVAPVPGTRKDIGAQVKGVLERIAQLHEGELSGVLALNLGTGPVARLDAAPPAAPAAREPAAPGRPLPPASEPLVEIASDPEIEVRREPALEAIAPAAGAPPARPLPAVGLPAAGAGPAPSAIARPRAAPLFSAPGSPAATIPDLPRGPSGAPAMTTVPGLAPPPIPVPPGIAEGPSAPLPPALGSSTLMGLGAAPKSPPPIPGLGTPVSHTAPTRRLGPVRAATPPVGVVTPRPAAVPAVPAAIPARPTPSPSPAARPSAARLESPFEERADSPFDDSLDAELEAELEETTAAPTAVRRAAAPRVTAAGAGTPPARLAVADIEVAALDALDPPAPLDAERITRDRAGTSSLSVEMSVVEPIADPDPGLDPVASARGDLRAEPALEDDGELDTIAARRAPGRRIHQLAVERDGGGDDDDDAASGVGTATLRTADFARAGAAVAVDARAADTAIHAAPPAPDVSGAYSAPRAAPYGTMPGSMPASTPGDGGGQPAEAPYGDALHGALAPGAPAPLAAPAALAPLAPAAAPAPILHPGPPGATGPVAMAYPVTSAPPGIGAPPRSPRRRVAILLSTLTVICLGVGGLVAYRAQGPGADEGPAGAGGSGRAPGGSGPGSAAGAAPAVPEPGSAVPPSAPSGSGSAPAPRAPAPPPAPTAPKVAELVISSTPPGARVFLDGADAGVTPVRLPGTSDRHTVALFLAGHDLYIAQVDGQGTFEIPLKEVTPPGGPAGIKVIRCKDKERYYVYVDGKPTGQTCPTERIDATLGRHTVEVYDLVTETRRKWDIVIKETRLSHRVRIDP